MARRANYYKLGLFVIAALFILVVAIIIWGAGFLFRDTIFMETYLDESVQGLELGSPVKYRGVPVGAVEKITFVNEEYANQLSSEELLRYGRLVLVRMEIDPNKLGLWDPSGRNTRNASHLERLIENYGLRVRLAPQGITGLAFMEADYVDPELFPAPEIPWDPHTYYFPSVQSTTGRFTEAAENLVTGLEDADIGRIGQNVNTLLEELIAGLEAADFDAIGSEVGTIADDLRETNRRIQELLAGDEIETILTSGAESAQAAERLLEGTEDDVTVILNEARQALEDLQEMTGEISRAFETGQIERTMDNITTASANFAVASEDLPETMEEIRETVRRIDQLVANQQYNIEVIVENLTQASENLREASVEARENPGVLFGEAPPVFRPGD